MDGKSERSVHPMLELLLYVDMNCIDASDIIRRVKEHDNVKSVIKNEIILTIKE